MELSIFVILNYFPFESCDAVQAPVALDYTLLQTN
jgi:hypothetical protein